MAANPAERASPGSIEELYRSAAARLVRMAWLAGGGRQEAEDLVQEAFARLASRTGPWPDEPVAFLRTVVVNLVRDRHRRRVIRQKWQPQPPPAAFGPEEVLTWSVLQTVPTRQRVAVILRYYEDLPINEIAAVMRCHESAVKSLIHRGLVQLRRELEP